MKLEKILDQLNSFEKNSFLKTISSLIDHTPKKAKEIEAILSETDKDLKNVDNINIAKVFGLLEEEFSSYVRSEMFEAESQLNILIDILVRDGNCIMSREWLNELYEKEIKTIQQKIKKFEIELEDEKSNISERRKRDYIIFKECLKTAYFNDQLLRNQECKVSSDEQSVLFTLSRTMGLSQEEIKLINYLIIKIKKENIESIINELKNIGIVFYSKKNLNVYVADEIVRVLRKVRGKEVADKYYRRILKLLREPQINLIAKNHNINWKDSLDQKIKSIINEGIGFSDVLINDMHKEGTKISDKKIAINNLIEDGLKISKLKGVTIEDKLTSLIEYFEQVERDDKVGISIDGYENLLSDIDQFLPNFKKNIIETFELQEDDIMKSSYLLDYNLKPIDILDLMSENNLKEFAEKVGAKTRGNISLNILERYKDSENLYIENYHLIASRDLSQLKENGLNIKEVDLGIKFEDITKLIFTKLGFKVDEKLRKGLNTTKDKIDIIINLSNNRLIIIECKTIKEPGYDKFSSISRQIKSYIKLAESNNFVVIKSLLIAPDFSADFEKKCREEYELNLSLITADTLKNILSGFKNTSLKEFPYQLLMKDVLIKEDWVLKAINK